MWPLTEACEVQLDGFSISTEPDLERLSTLFSQLLSVAMAGAVVFAVDRESSVFEETRAAYLVVAMNY